MKCDLLLTLGHNSSAIAICDGKIVYGYEEERFSKIKSDSAFPIMAINAIGASMEYDKIYVSHWEPFGNLKNMKKKHWDPDLLPKHNQIVTLNKDFTHHDAHAYSARAFVGAEIPRAHTIVADGFGNFGEVLSIYDEDLNVIQRVFGYNKSLGLMYQYAIAYLGMKMNEDEYKLLGYESHIKDAKALELQFLIDKITSEFIKGFNDVELMKDDDPLFKTTALLDTQLYWEEMLEPCGKDRVNVAFVVQSVLEKVLAFIVRKYHMHDVILAGGCFLNVKANNSILNITHGRVSVMPLSGDQGAALGLYKKFNPDWIMPDNLYWGRRTLEKVDMPRTHNYSIASTMSRKLVQLLRNNKIVNVVYGSMEFGPRALCHTSTLALPNMENVDYINQVNGRTTIMPMGPVMSKTKATDLFPEIHRVVKSQHHMIMALDYDGAVKNSYRGAAHNLPLQEGFTGRPQVLNHYDKVVGAAVSEFGILINTSFNIHGVPIVFESDDIEKCLEYQLKRDVDNRIYTLILLGENHDI